MTKRMLIDASHPEETRVVVADGTRIEELDFESSAKRQLRGNVYLARVTRVEPSLQAAFVEYGGNRHGFLAFSEIHPDYYQIPYEDRMALLKADEEDAIAEAEEEEEAADAAGDDTSSDTPDDEASEDDSADETVSEGDDDATEEQNVTAKKRRRQSSRRRYKIQEVIKRGQILLIQVVKEERGNKGAAMTTYLSLAGRYCVFMPNTPRGGGISRKIANGSDRKRLKTIVADLDVPKGIGVIVRTAGAKRTKTEIKRDYDYLSRLWETIREKTLKSIAPSLIHEEGDLVKRSIRDLYDKDITEILVQGDDAYKDAKTFIKMLMPSHAKNVKAYKDKIPLLLRYDIERQLEDSLSSLVQLKSGGYLVIHPTEALVSIDVNSGRSTKERNVERTALKTNLEAADEVARQMRLRDLAGLVVIDFIDMDENKNNRAVQNRMKEALSRDRARVQAGRISQFGLMEISRQRRRRSLLDASTTSCPHCQGVGRQRSTESSALRALRAATEIGVRGRAARIRLGVTPDVALYMINEKRARLSEIESAYGMFIELYADDSLLKPDFGIDVLESREAENGDPLAEIEKELRKERQKERDESRSKKKKSSKSKDDEDEGRANSHSAESSEDDEDKPRRRRRRGRRGGRRRRGENTEDVEQIATENSEEDAIETASEESSETPKKGRRRRAPKGRAAENEADNKTIVDEADTDEAKAPKAKRGGRRKAPTRKTPIEDVKDDVKATDKDSKPDETVEAVEDKPAKKSSSRSTSRRAAPKRKAPKVAESAEDAPKPKRTRKAPAKKAAPKKASSSTSTTRRKAPTRKTVDTTETAKIDAKEAETVEKKPAAKKTRKAPAKKAAVKKAPTKKAPVKKAAAKTVAAKKAPAKKAAPKKAATKKATAKAANAKTAATKKAPTKKAAPKKPAPKKAPSKKPVAKKTPAKPAELKGEDISEVKKTTRKAPARKSASVEPPETLSVAPDIPQDTAKVSGKKTAKKRGWLQRLTGGKKD